MNRVISVDTYLFPFLGFFPGVCPFLFFFDFFSLRPPYPLIAEGLAGESGSKLASELFPFSSPSLLDSSSSSSSLLSPLLEPLGDGDLSFW